MGAPYITTLYMQQTTHTTYVRRQNHIEHIGDMLDSMMSKANVIHRWKINACIWDDVKNV